MFRSTDTKNPTALATEPEPVKELVIPAPVVWLALALASMCVLLLLWCFIRLVNREQFERRFEEAKRIQVQFGTEAAKQHLAQ